MQTLSNQFILSTSKTKQEVVKMKKLFILFCFAALGIALVHAEYIAPGDLDVSGEINATDLVILANYLNGNLEYMPNHSGYLYDTDSIVGNLRLVRGGVFTQGSPSDEPCRVSDEDQFNHILTRNLAVMETEVTQGMWEALDAVQSDLPDNPSSFSGSDRPVEQVTWYEAVLFANLLSVQQGFTRCYYTDEAMTTPIDASNYNDNDTMYCHFNADGYRLPTEGEWEYFCRAGTTGPFWVNELNYDSGNCDLCTGGLLPYLEQAAVFCANDPGGTAVVGGKDENPWGLRDVHGNVWEWCWDWYDSDYPTGSMTDYAGPGSGSDRVGRGGSWLNGALSCRSANRIYVSPDSRGNNLGFRLLRSSY